MSLWQWIATWFRHPPAPARPPLPPVAEPIVALLDAVNEARHDHGLDLLQADARLDNLALLWAQSMAANRILGHGDFAGRIARVYPNRACAENIAQGQRNAEQVVSSWMDSPGHRANMLNATYVLAGCGRADDYWCLDLAEV